MLAKRPGVVIGLGIGVMRILESYLDFAAGRIVSDSQYHLRTSSSPRPATLLTLAYLRYPDPASRNQIDHTGGWYFGKSRAKTG